MKIEKYLILNRYLLSLFGVNEFKELQEKLKDVRSDYNTEGRSRFVSALCGLSGLNEDRLSENSLLKYDEHIRFYTGKINYRREPKVLLKYFQYLSVLLMEIVLDNLQNRNPAFLLELNDFLKHHKKEHDIAIIDDFAEEDLQKFAFWMATGSGKTLIMHINYYQFQQYKLFSPDNILLITPNEGLSKQHFEELQKSGVPCRLYGGSINSIGRMGCGNEVLILEMTKLVEEKKGGGVTLPIDVFEGRNLLFVDEGHKGKKSEEQKWAKLRNKVAEKGFVFEYSATFGQILSENNKEILNEYAKSIIFDYSYKYFYLDGYGKDFAVMNVRQGQLSDTDFQETMFVANMLSFYEQMAVYDENENLAKKYNLEKPLWVFVGTTVTGKEEESDVVRIVGFLNKVLKDEGWMYEKAMRILDGKTGLRDENDEDVFINSFAYLKQKGVGLENIFRKIFGGKGAFGVYDIKNAEGELGLKVGENDYFGVINIGDVSGFKKRLEDAGIPVMQDAVSNSLFETIKKDKTTINVLIGSKKFIEGWDTWRVSSMGLLNIGTGQGPQIIQLFGRGIRLKGKGMSLQRSGEKSAVQYLERLNIYGIKADYLSRFLDAIKREDVDYETIQIPVKPQHKEKWGRLYYIAKSARKFEEELVLPLEIDKNVHAVADLLPKISVYLGEERKEDGIKIEELRADVKEKPFPKDLVPLIDWDNILTELYEFRSIRGYWNLIFNMDRLKNILCSNRCNIKVLPQMLAVHKSEDVKRVEEIAILTLKKYIEKFYNFHANRFDTKTFKYELLKRQEMLALFDKGDGSYAYTVQVEKTETGLIEDIRNLAQNFEKLLKDEKKTLPRVYFGQHLYLPILLNSNTKIEKISPGGLVKSEEDFVVDLKQYLTNNKKRFEGYEVYLLRNFPKSGIGFFNRNWFYPDFIMWIKSGKKQSIFFIDPKGLEHTKGLEDEKVKLAENIKDLEREWGRNDIRLESYILSATDWDTYNKHSDADNTQEEYEKHHVLFLDDEDWPRKMFEAVLKGDSPQVKQK